jgi:YVTN family beta-propeller protein
MTRRESPQTRTRTAGAGVVAVAMVALATVAPPGVAKANDHRRPATGTLWVTNQAGSPGTVFVVDAGTGNAVATIPVGARPIGVVAAPGSSHVYVSNETDGSVSVIDKTTLEVVDTIRPLSKPHHIAMSPNGRVLYVAEFASRTVAAIDTTTNKVLNKLWASKDSSARTHAVWVSSDGKTLYATNSGADTIGVIDARRGLLEEIEVGPNPSEVLVTRDAKTAYVSLRDAHAVQAIDLASRQISQVVLEPGSQPDTLQLTNDGRTLVVALRGNPAQVALVDTAELSVRSVVKIAGHNTTGHHWLSADSKHTFVALEGPAGVAVIDNQAAAVVDVYPLSPATARPHGLFYEPGGTRT